MYTSIIEPPRSLPLASEIERFPGFATCVLQCPPRPPPCLLLPPSFPQAAKLRKELGWAGVASMPVDAIIPGTGGGGGTMGDALQAHRKLTSVRAASIVVATACGFEHALHQVMPCITAADQ